MLRRTMLKGVAACAIVGVVPRPASAQEVLKMGISIPMTGAGFNAVGRQLAAAIKLYVEQHGDTIAGRKIEIILRDDAGVADNARRIVQEMIVNEKVGLIGIGAQHASATIFFDGAPRRLAVNIAKPPELLRKLRAYKGSLARS